MVTKILMNVPVLAVVLRRSGCWRRPPRTGCCPLHRPGPPAAGGRRSEARRTSQGTRRLSRCTRLQDRPGALAGDEQVAVDRADDHVAGQVRRDHPLGERAQARARGPVDPEHLGVLQVADVEVAVLRVERQLAGALEPAARREDAGEQPRVPLELLDLVLILDRDVGVAVRPGDDPGRRPRRLARIGVADARVDRQRRVVRLVAEVRRVVRVRDPLMDDLIGKCQVWRRAREVVLLEHQRALGEVGRVLRLQHEHVVLAIEPDAQVGHVGVLASRRRLAILRVGQRRRQRVGIAGDRVGRELRPILAAVGCVSPFAQRESYWPWQVHRSSKPCACDHTATARSGSSGSTLIDGAVVLAPRRVRHVGAREDRRWRQHRHQRARLERIER